MSFGTYARKVLDTDLPLPRRARALRSCVSVYHPIGYYASLSFLEEIAGPYLHDEASLLRALDALTASRELWLADLRAYTATRRREKAQGNRSPRPDAPNPSSPRRWYGASRRAALHALRTWQTDALTEPMRSCLAACRASGGTLTAEQWRVFTGRRDELRKMYRRPGLYAEDGMTHFRTVQQLKLADMIAIVAGPDS